MHPLLAAVRGLAERAAYPALFVAGLALSDPQAQVLWLHSWALGTAVGTGWYIAAKHHHRHTVAAAADRTAADRAHRARLAADPASRARQQAGPPARPRADWFNHDGPYTRAGQPR